MLVRHRYNPIITREDVSAALSANPDVTSVFNPGAVKWQNRYFLMLRVQFRSRATSMLMAESDDGVNFTIRNEPLHLQGIEEVDERIYHCYDPRITRIDSIFYVMFAMDMESGCRLGLAESADLREFFFKGIVSDRDNRNGVLFPQKIRGRYARFDRPNVTELAGGVASGSSIWLSESDDLLTWKPVGIAATGNPHYWDELIGAGPPPVKTEKGWLLVYHGIARHFHPIYQAGAMLLDLDNPLKVIARGKNNILEPREMYEMVGQVPNVVFPNGMIVDDYDDSGFARPSSRMLVYYGAADTCVCLAETTVEKTIDACFK